jgi:outer membrane protein assembly factor BamA
MATAERTPGGKQRPRGLAGLALALAAGLVAGPAAATTQQGGQPAPGATPPPVAVAATSPTFLIESFVVEGARHASADLIVAESLLRPGRTYGETDLRHAVYRIKRLPFILDARFALRKGSERGAYVLAITVEETHRPFFGADVSATWDTDALVFGTGTVGGRTFVGADGVAFAALDGAVGEVGYTHYNLFGRRIFAGITYARQSSCCEGLSFDNFSDSRLPSSGSTRQNFDTQAARLDLGFPLAGNHSLRLGITRSESESSFDFRPGDPLGVASASDSSAKGHAADLAWIYDSTDDPVVPHQGRVAGAGLTASRVRDHDVFHLAAASGGEPEITDASTRETRDVRVSGNLSQYWPLSQQNTLGLQAVAAAGRSRFDVEAASSVPFGDEARSFDSRLQVAFAHDLRRAGDRWRRWGDLRCELALVGGYDRRSVAGLPAQDSYFGGFSVGLVLRNAWGVFRLSLSHEVVSG